MRSNLQYTPTARGLKYLSPWRTSYILLSNSFRCESHICMHIKIAGVASPPSVKNTMNTVIEMLPWMTHPRQMVILQSKSNQSPGRKRDTTFVPKRFCRFATTIQISEYRKKRHKVVITKRFHSKSVRLARWRSALWRISPVKTTSWKCSLNFNLFEVEILSKHIRLNYKSWFLTTQPNLSIPLIITPNVDGRVEDFEIDKVLFSK